MTGQPDYKMKFLTLTHRTSKKGTEYLQGVWGNLSVVAFKGKPTQWGETWDCFFTERQQKGQYNGNQQQFSGPARPSPEAQELAALFQKPLDR